MSETNTIDQVVDIIEKMTVMELSELSKTLQDKFGVSAAAPVMMGGPMAGGAGGEAAAEEKDAFEVVLAGFGEKKINVIKEIRAITGLGLKEAKDLVEGAPSTVKEDATKEEADGIKKQLEEAGATVELK